MDQITEWLLCATKKKSNWCCGNQWVRKTKTLPCSLKSWWAAFQQPALSSLGNWSCLLVPALTRLICKGVWTDGLCQSVSKSQDAAGPCRIQPGEEKRGPILNSVCFTSSRLSLENNNMRDHKDMKWCWGHLCWATFFLLKQMKMKYVAAMDE